MSRLDVLVTRKKDDKTYYTKVGAAFPTRDGRGWSITLDALPIDGQLLLLPPREKRAPSREPGDDDEPWGNT